MSAAASSTTKTNPVLTLRPNAQTSTGQRRRTMDPAYRGRGWLPGQGKARIAAGRDVLCFAAGRENYGDGADRLSILEGVGVRLTNSYLLRTVSATHYSEVGK